MQDSDDDDEDGHEQVDVVPQEGHDVELAVERRERRGHRQA